jgi:hypothetical protein
VALNVTTLELMNPVPVIVRFCWDEPATRLPGAIEVIPGVGFVAPPVEGG